MGYAERTIGRRGALTLPCCGHRTRWSKRLTAPPESDPKPTKTAFPFATNRSLNPGLDVHHPLGMNPGMPVLTTGLSLTRVVIP